MAAVILDMQYHDNVEVEPGETLEEAEAKIGFGIADWIDPGTGEPAGKSVPRVRDE